jgi:hypothetical protein
LRRSAEEALLVEPPPRPWLLQTIQIVAGLFGILAPVLLSLAPFDIGTYTISGQRVSGPEFLRRAGVWFAGAGACCLAIAYALWRERPWAREVMLGTWILLVMVGSGSLVAKMGISSEAMIGMLEALLLAVLGAWYLYRKSNVVDYFEAVRILSARSQSNPSS